MKALARRIDWLTIFAPRHQDNDTQAKFNRLITLAKDCNARTGLKAKQWDFRVASGKLGKDANFKMEIWGMTAHLVADELDTWAWAHVTRIDLRQELPSLGINDIKTFVAGVQRRGVKGVNLLPFDMKPKNKSEGRDGGGKGVALGAYGSDNQISTYVRGAETPAYEYRARNNNAKEVVNQALAELGHQDYSLGAMTDQVMAIMTGKRVDWSHKVTGYASFESYINDVISEERERDEVLEAALDRKKLEGGQLSYFHALSDVLPGETDAFTLNVCPNCTSVAPTPGGYCANCGAKAVPAS